MSQFETRPEPIRIELMGERFSLKGTEDKEAALAAAGCDVFIIQASENRRAEVLSIASALRDQGYSVDIPLTFTKFNGQMQKAVKSGARLALVVGDEFPTLELRDLTARTSAQIVMEDLFDSIATAANLA